MTLSDPAVGRLLRYCRQARLMPPEHDRYGVRHVNGGVLRVVRGDGEVHAALVRASAGVGAFKVLAGVVPDALGLDLLDLTADAA